jgi:hypothetical protein
MRLVGARKAAAPDAENQSAVADLVDGGGLLGDAQRMAERQYLQPALSLQLDTVQLVKIVGEEDRRLAAARVLRPIPPTRPSHAGRATAARRGTPRASTTLAGFISR